MDSIDRRLTYEPPRMLRLTGARDAAATCTGGSGATQYCEPSGNTPQGGYCIAGGETQWVCGAGSTTGVCTAGGSRG